jgi:hypothetical protein
MMLERAPQQQAAAAARQRAYRRRVARGEVIAPTPVGVAVIELLLRLGYLAEKDAVDRWKIGEAAGRALLSATRADNSLHVTLAAPPSD